MSIAGQSEGANLADLRIPDLGGSLPSKRPELPSSKHFEKERRKRIFLQELTH